MTEFALKPTANAGLGLPAAEHHIPGNLNLPRSVPTNAPPIPDVDKLNLFQSIGVEQDPTIGIHTTFVPSGSCVMLPPADSEKTRDIIMSIGPEPNELSRIASVVASIVALVPSSLGSPESNRVVNEHSIASDLQTKALVPTAPAMVSHGSRNPMAAVLGLNRNGAYMSTLATADGTMGAQPLTTNEVIARHTTAVENSIVIGNRACFVPNPEDGNSVQNTQRAMGIAPPLHANETLVGLVLNEHKEVEAVPLTRNILKAVADDDPSVVLVGWLGSSATGVWVYGKNALLTPSGSPKLPVLMLNTAEPLKTPGAADAELVGYVNETLDTVLGNPPAKRVEPSADTNPVATVPAAEPDDRLATSAKNANGIDSSKPVTATAPLGQLGMNHHELPPKSKPFWNRS